MEVIKRGLLTVGNQKEIYFSKIKNILMKIIFMIHKKLKIVLLMRMFIFIIYLMN